MIISMLGSGSKGNATYISCDGVALLIDAGLSLRQLEKRANDKRLPLENIKAIFISHEHTDHWMGAFKLAEKLQAPVFIDKVQFAEIRHKYAVKSWCKGFYDNSKHFKFVEQRQLYPHLFGKLKIDRFYVSHDTTLNKGFIIDDGVNKVGIVTDLGFVTRNIYDILVNCNIVVLESNHDLEMLRTGKYPQHIKDRVESNKGHLSNDQCAHIVKHLDRDITKLVILAHVSQDNNTVDKIKSSFNNVSTMNENMIRIASQEYGSDVFFIN